MWRLLAACIMSMQYTGGYHCEHTGVVQYTGGNHEYTGECSVHWGIP